MLIHGVSVQVNKLTQAQKEQLADEPAVILAEHETELQTLRLPCLPATTTTRHACAFRQTKLIANASMLASEHAGADAEGPASRCAGSHTC